MEITEEQRKRAEANRLAAIEKRKRALAATSVSGGGSGKVDGQDPWILFKCKKVISNDYPVHYQKKQENEPPPPPPPPPPSKFRVVLEICSPNDFSIAPEPVKDFNFPGIDECFRRIEECLSLIPFCSIESQTGRKTVYSLQDYDAVASYLKKLDGVQLKEVPYKTRKVVESFSACSGQRWIPCMPHHLSDSEVDQLIEKLPKMLREGLLPFQLEGVIFGLRRGGRCLIADEMGLGKTLQAIAIASCFVDEGPILVVCPAVLRYSWAEEFEHWLPLFLPTDIHLVFGHQNNLDHIERSPQIVVISFTMLHRLRTSMSERHWAVMIVDESHNLRCTKKKSESGETQTVLHMATKIKHIILLSGTPSLSRPYDIFHQVNILWPKLLGNDKYEFATNYCSPLLVKGVQGKIYKDFSRGIRLEELNVLLSQSLMIRRLKENVLSQLPPKRRQIIRVKLRGSDVLRATSSLKSETVCPNKEMNSIYADDGSVDEISAGKDIPSVRKSDQNVCPRSLKELSYQELGIAKLSCFYEWLNNHNITTDVEDSFNLGAPLQKMIIFAHHIKVLDGIQEFICEKGIKFVRIDGTTSARDRQIAVESFRVSSEIKIVLISITAGGVGLDFSSAQNVVFVELPKSASEMLQAEDRAHRRGQTNALNIYIFCAKDTLDESRWLHLNTSLYRVSSMMNGKVNAVKNIEVDGIYHLGDVQNSLQYTNFAESAADKQNNDASDCLVVNARNDNCDGEENEIILVKEESSKYKADNFPLLQVGKYTSLGEAECDNSDDLRNITSDHASPSKSNAVGQIEENGSICFRAGDILNFLPAETEQSNPVHPESLRFEVSPHTGRIHLYTCSSATDSRPKPLFQNFRAEDLETMAACLNKSNHSSLSLNENLACRDMFKTFIKEWNDLRPIERNKLFGKPLQLPLSLELCYLEETRNHGREGLLKGGSKRRTTTFDDINSKLPPNAVWKKIILHRGSAKERCYAQAWTLANDPLCKLCQTPCKKPEYFEDLFCNLNCYDEYRIRMSQRSLRLALFQIEHGICTQCNLDCHKLVKSIRVLSIEKRREYIKRVAPQLAKQDKILEKLVSDPKEGNAWHADHIVPVYKGGGECRLENMRTLCVACHSKVTADQRVERNRARKSAKEQLKLVMKELKCDADNNNSKVGDSNTAEYGQLEVEKNIDDELLIHVPGSSYHRQEDDNTSLISEEEIYTIDLH